MNLMYASSSLTPMSIKPRIQEEKKKFDFFRKMMQDMFHYVDKQQLIPAKEYDVCTPSQTVFHYVGNKLKSMKHPLIPGKYYYIDNIPIVRNYIDESHWILMRGKYIGPVAYPGGMGNLNGHQFSDLTYVYISEYNDKLPLSGPMILAENWCRFIYDSAQPSDADIAQHRQHMDQISREFGAMRAAPVTRPGIILEWIGEDFRAARDRQTDPETGSFDRQLVIPSPYSRSPLPCKNKNKNNNNKNNNNKNKNKNKKTSISA